MKTETVRTYLAALERLMITDDVPAWKPDLRSRTASGGQRSATCASMPRRSGSSLAPVTASRASTRWSRSRSVPLRPDRHADPAREVHTLKGVADEWRLFSVVPTAVRIPEGLVGEGGLEPPTGGV